MGSCIARPGAFAPLATARKGHGVDMYVLAELSLTATISIAVAAFLVGGVGGVVLIRMMTGGTIRAAKRDAENIRQKASAEAEACLLYTSPSPRDAHESRMPSSA